MAVIRYISNEHSPYQTFVANSLAIIHAGFDKEQWRYIDSSLNQADQASRGIQADDKRTL